MSDCTIIAREDEYWPRKIHEAICIRTMTPDLNRDKGYDLPPIFVASEKSF